MKQGCAFQPYIIFRWKGEVRDKPVSPPCSAERLFLSTIFNSRGQNKSTPYVYNKERSSKYCGNEVALSNYFDRKEERLALHDQQ